MIELFDLSFSLPLFLGSALIVAGVTLVAGHNRAFPVGSWLGVLGAAFVLALLFAGPSAFTAWPVMAYGVALYAVYAVTVKAGAWARGGLRRRPRVIQHGNGRRAVVDRERYRPLPEREK